MNSNLKKQFVPILVLSALYLPFSFIVERDGYGIAAGLVLFSFLAIALILFLLSLFVTSLKKYTWGFLLSIPILFLIGFSVCSYRNII